MDELTPKLSNSPIGQYYLIEKIAQGGMAEIFKGLAFDLHGIKRTVVIKKILPKVAADPEFIEMLIAEAKIAVLLNHGNIAQVYDLGKIGGDYFIVMEYVDGHPLSKLHRHCLAGGELMPIEITCHIIAEVANGLHYMHRKTTDDGKPLHIIHRDMSPQNIMLSFSGTVKIIDFGIAKASTHPESTQSGILKGKLAYMSPEQAFAEPIDHRTDIFSLGIILHELLTGRRLFKADTKRDTLKNVRETPIEAPSLYRRDIPEELDRIALKALSRSRNSRYMYASDFRQDLLKFLHATYPDFTAEDVSNFLKRLYKDDIEAKADEEESKTPLLIIDHTQSAILDDDNKEPCLPPDFSKAPDDSAEDKEELPELEAPNSKASAESVWIKKIIRRLLQCVLFTVTAAGIAFLTIHFQLIERGYILFRSTPPVGAPEIATTKSEEEKKVTPIPRTTVEIHSTPSGARVFFNDQDTGRSTPTILHSVPLDREHTIGLFLKHHLYWSTTIHPREEKKTIRFNPKLEMNYSALKIITSPAGAEIFINEMNKGPSPLEMAKLIPGQKLSIMAVKEGYESWRQEIYLEAGQQILLNPTLKRVVNPP